MVLSFIEDSTTLSICLPESDKLKATEILNKYKLTLVDGLNPEEVTAVDARKFAALPDDKRQDLAKKRTLQQFRRLALSCRVISMQRFLCNEIRRLGGTAPTQRERQAARDRQDARQARREQPTAPQDDSGWTRVQRRRTNNILRRPTSRPATDGNATPLPAELPSEQERDWLDEFMNGDDCDNVHHAMDLIADAASSDVDPTGWQSDESDSGRPTSPQDPPTDHIEEITMADPRREASLSAAQPPIQKKARRSSSTGAILLNAIGAASSPAEPAQ
jgi:hypothetical protein